MRIGLNLLTCNAEDKHLAATQFAVQSLLESDVRDFDWALQIVDNGSTHEPTREWLERIDGTCGERVACAFLGENIGIARGRNHGYRLLEAFGCDYMVEIHNDHIFPNVWLAPLVDEMERSPGVGLIGPALFQSRQPVFDWSLGYLPVDYANDPYNAVMSTVNANACLYRQAGRVVPGLTHPAVKRWKMLEEIGLYDEGLPGLTNWEDTEELYRAYLAGWRSMVHFGSVVFHYYTFSRMHVRRESGPDYWANREYCLRKHGPAFLEFASKTLGGWMDEAYQVKREARV